jgi:hypothetical protein
MYFVNEKIFDDLFDALDHCKATPASTLRSEKGRVLMKHVHVPFEVFRDIELAKAVLAIQTST